MTHAPALAVGDIFATLELAPVTRTQLALYAGASGDHNPIHIDMDFAHAAGEKDVFAQGMFVMASLSRLLTANVPLTALRSFGTRFLAMTHLGDRLTLTATVAELFEAEGEQRMRLDLAVRDQNGEQKLAGAAILALTSQNS
ncbi:MaoC/PaaZ C-terminal domain-containing protein [Xanthobacter autotrophicus]|uniref:MaoC/PaaZ C-terminal domain-containing protein n=1 Tax=Xanthobacter autotrophicus TaxID=280 RepID=UPI0024A6AA74|nr:MaoC/PaaZ C-terminal domain-containing protein [Xanthobacter autotrophicus]MDI4655441.1 MaoC family dehydratase N-terminal domain-containing protein [Xanthobacter autotrophicus]